MSLAEDVSSLLIEFRESRDSENMDDTEIQELWSEMKEEITELFFQDDFELSERTLAKEVQESLDPIARPADNGELKPYFEEIITDLRTESTYTAYIYFPGLVELPVGKEIGELEIIERPEKKEDLIDRIDKAIEGHEHYTQLYEGRNWGKFVFNSYKRRAFLREEFFDQIQTVLGALSVSIGRTSTPEQLAGAIYNGQGYIWHLDPDQEPSGWSRYSENTAEPTLTDLSNMIKRDEGNRSPLEENILGSIQLLTLHSNNYRNEHSFLTLVAVLEGLLLTKYERPKAGKMAEKTVQLLYPDQESQREIPGSPDVNDKIEDYNRIKGWYHTRSEIIHGGYENISREKVRSVERTVERVAKELVRLTDEYHAIQKQGGDSNPYQGLNEMFLEKRLQTTFDTEENQSTDDDTSPK